MTCEEALYYLRRDLHRYRGSKNFNIPTEVAAAIIDYFQDRLDDPDVKAYGELIERIRGEEEERL